MNNDFYFQNTPFVVALAGSARHDDPKEAALEELMNCYDNVSKDQVEKHLSEFQSREEMEHYIRNLAIRNKEIDKWE